MDVTMDIGLPAFQAGLLAKNITAQTSPGVKER
jgi:hypothetical protein